MFLSVLLRICVLRICFQVKEITASDGFPGKNTPAAAWHPLEGFKPLSTRLFIGASYASAACYPMDDGDVIVIGLRVIKRCGMYTEEAKTWILRENAVPQIIKMINSFKEYWTNAIAPVNQTAVPALQHGYGMTAIDDEALVASYGDLLASFGATFAATKETMKSQANSLVAMQNQLVNIQLCMNVGQWPPSSSYASAQQQCTFTNHNKHNGSSQGNGRGFPQQPTMNFGGMGSGQQQNIHPPNSYKCWKIGTTATPRVVMLMAITPVGHVANQVLCTTNMGVHQHHGWISCWNAKDHLALNFQPHSTQLPPPAAAAPSAMFAQCLLPSWRHSWATTNPSRTVWWKATSQPHLLPSNNHGYAGISAQQRNDDECRAVPSGCRKYANDADGPTANGGTHVDESLCPQPAAQPDVLVFLTSRGG
jgi:hypothetical protein